MVPTDEFITNAEQELFFVRALMERIEEGLLIAPGLDRKRAVAFLAEVAAERTQLLARLQPYRVDGGKVRSGAPI